MSGSDPATGNIEDGSNTSLGQPLPGQASVLEEVFAAMNDLDMKEDFEQEPPGCSDYLKEYPPSDDYELEESFPENIPWNSSHRSGAVLKTVIRPGKSLESVPHDSRVYFKYVAFTETRKIPYDTAHKLKHKSVVLGKDSVIPGLEIALKGMSVGEVAHFRIAPDFGFGQVGCPQIGVPGGATLVYTVHMLQFIPGSTLSTIFFMTKEELQDLDFSELLAGVNVHVEEVKDLYVHQKYEEAHKIAKRLRNILDNRWTKNEAQHGRKEKYMAWILLYQGLCSIELEDFHRAKKELCSGLRLEIHPYKMEMYFQLAVVSVELGEFQWARRNLKNIKERCSPMRSDRERMTDLTEKINAAQKEDKLRERNLERRMARLIQI